MDSNLFQVSCSIHLFIISWKGQHQNAILIAQQVSLVTNNITIVYSDPDSHFVLDVPFNSIKRPNDLYWSDKFETCLHYCNNEPMLVIHADCKCDDWSALVKGCNEVIVKNNSIGVWAPKIEGTPYYLERTKIAAVTYGSFSLAIAAQTDGIVFALSPTIINRMKKLDYKSNKYGWGIDWIFCCAAYASNLLVVVDDKYTVVHPLQRGYDTSKAVKEMNAFLKQLNSFEFIQYRLLTSYLKLSDIRKLANIIMIWLINSLGLASESFYEICDAGITCLM